MLTECNPTLFEFAPVEGRQVDLFDGASDHNGCRCIAAGRDRPDDPCMSEFCRTRAARDVRTPELVEHEVSTLVLHQGGRHRAGL